MGNTFSKSDIEKIIQELEALTSEIEASGGDELLSQLERAEELTKTGIDLLR